jgi:hypothetical protein
MKKKIFMKNRKINALIIAMLMMMGLAMTSCVGDDPYYSPLVGTWELNFTQAGGITDINVVKYAFYSDGTGTYGYYDNGGYWQNMSIVWTAYYDDYAGEDVVSIRYEDGYEQNFYYRFDGGYLYLSGVANFYTYDGYISVPE